jgi:hypothetical protein
MAFDTFSYTSLLDELEHDQIDFDLPAWPWSTKESPGHESVVSVDSGTGSIEVFGDASPRQEDLELDYDPNLNEGAVGISSILDELESVDLTVMQKTNTRSFTRGVAMTPVLPVLKERDVYLTNLLDIALDVADIPSLRRVASGDCRKNGSVSSNDGSVTDMESDQADAVGVRSLGGKSVSFMDKNKIDFSKAKILGVVMKNGSVGVKNIETHMSQLAGKAKVLNVEAPKHERPTRHARAQHMSNLIKDVSSEFNETVGQMEKEEVEIRNKHATHARIQRRKKKVYVTGLEKENEELKKENVEMREKLLACENEKNSYEEEILYLKSVLANQSTLSSLLQNIEGVESVNLSTSFSRKRHAVKDHDYTDIPAKKSKKTGAGVCLHVTNKDNVSLEFCSKCAKKAS